MLTEMSEQEIEIQHKKIDQLQKIINRLEVMTMVISFLQGVGIFITSLLLLK